MERIHLYLSGRVQGVGMRWHARDTAAALNGLTGFVRNLPDGRVEIVAEGSAEILAEFTRRLRDGFPGTGISRVEQKTEAGRGTFPDFSIRF